MYSRQRTIPRIAFLLMVLPVLLAGDQFSEKHVYVNAIFLKKSAHRSPGTTAVLVAWPDGRLQHVDCVVHMGTEPGTVRLLFDGSTQVTTGRWERRGRTMLVKIPPFPRHSSHRGPVIEGQLRMEGNALGRLAARLRGVNVQFEAVERVENLSELEELLGREWPSLPEYYMNSFVGPGR